MSADGQGGVAAGFVASRFLKASSRERYQGYQARTPATGVQQPPAVTTPPADGGYGV